MNKGQALDGQAGLQKKVAKKPLTRVNSIKNSNYSTMYGGSFNSVNDEVGSSLLKSLKYQ
jgi:hypothetical protein